jgi:hypothetical protein
MSTKSPISDGVSLPLLKTTLILSDSQIHSLLSAETSGDCPLLKSLLNIVHNLISREALVLKTAEKPSFIPHSVDLLFLNRASVSLRKKRERLLTCVPLVRLLAKLLVGESNPD